MQPTLMILLISQTNRNRGKPALVSNSTKSSQESYTAKWRATILIEELGI